jgi:uncharacterized protein
MTTTGTADAGLPVAPQNTTLTPISLNNVQITGGYWHQKQRTNGETSIRHAEEWIEKVGWTGNFDAALEGRLPQDRTGREFSDSDVYKLMEAMAWEIGRTSDAAMEERFQRLVARIAPVQEEDGYINTKFGRPGQAARYSDLQWGHELYTFGHLIQAGIARGRTHGEDLFVDIARRAADHVCEAFGDNGNQGVCGHPEIEVALVEFSRYTGDRKYLDQALRFIDRRGYGTLGDIEFGASYFQDDKPVRQTTVMSGHSVRALYLAAGAIDAAVDSEDDSLLKVLAEQVATTTARRTYITGGMGAHHEGESFGQDYELPADRAYSETCAGVGSVMVNYRLLLATGAPQYADLIERTLYNVVAASPAQDGKAFFYTNTLHQREEGHTPSDSHPSPRAASSLRAPWFEVSCCPTNVARTLSSLGALMATRTAEGVQIHQYATSAINADVAGSTVRLQVTTDYPRSGRITVEILESPERAWELALRVPGWAGNRATLTVGNESRPASAGTVSIERKFAPGDLVELALPVEPRWIRPDPRVDAIRGTVAVERGPQVLCLESTDAEGQSVNFARIDTRAPLLDEDGVTTAELRFAELSPVAWPYTDDGDNQAPLSGTLRVALHPYASWANRGPSTMRVWIPEEQGAGSDMQQPEAS